VAAANGHLLETRRVVSHTRHIGELRSVFQTTKVEVR